MARGLRGSRHQVRDGNLTEKEADGLWKAIAQSLIDDEADGCRPVLDAIRV